MRYEEGQALIFSVAKRRALNDIAAGINPVEALSGYSGATRTIITKAIAEAMREARDGVADRAEFLRRLNAELALRPSTARVAGEVAAIMASQRAARI
jgi:ABC-type antimicrobial peptide transport system ATPase subunit